MKRMVVEIQELQKVAAAHQEAATVEQRDALAPKWTEGEKLVTQKVNPFQLTTAAMSPQRQLK